MMKKNISVTLLFFLLVSFLLFPHWAYGATRKQEPAVMAQSAVLLDENGRILYSRNAESRRQPASTTKIMTALLTVESCADLNQVVSISRHTAAVGESTIDLEFGDQISLSELLHGALIRSGNDACVALAEACAPSEEEFVGLMNLKAKALGAFDTTFQNTNGLPNDAHLTTAYDLALITRYAMKNPVIRSIVKKKSYTLHWVSPRVQMTIYNTNQLLLSYPQAIGVKTGTTVKAGRCLVAAARDGETEMIAVVLNSPDRFGDARRLLEYGLNKEKKNG